jgi:uncharacterized protein YciW
MLKKNLTKQELQPLRDAIDSLDGWEDAGITALDVQLDTLASALSELQSKRQKRKTLKHKDPTLSDELAALQENDLSEPVPVALADEIAELIRTKDYVGYAEGYVEERLSELVGELCSELNELIERLANAASE